MECFSYLFFGLCFCFLFSFFCFFLVLFVVLFAFCFSCLVCFFCFSCLVFLFFSFVLFCFCCLCCFCLICFCLLFVTLFALLFCLSCLLFISFFVMWCLLFLGLWCFYFILLTRSFFCLVMSFFLLGFLGFFFFFLSCVALFFFKLKTLMAVWTKHWFGNKRHSFLVCSLCFFQCDIVFLYYFSWIWDVCLRVQTTLYDKIIAIWFLLALLYSPNHTFSHRHPTSVHVRTRRCGVDGAIAIMFKTPYLHATFKVWNISAIILTRRHPALGLSINLRQPPS